MPGNDGPGSQVPGGVDYNVWPAADPGVMALNEGISGAGNQGTGYISFADYIRGNQQQLGSERAGLDADAMATMKGAQDKYDTSATAALAGLPGVERQEWNDETGRDTAQAYRDYQDAEATRAAHPGQDVNLPTNYQLPDQYGQPDSTGVSTVQQGATGSNPWDLTSHKADFQDIENRLGNTQAGQTAATDFQALQDTAGKTANLANWGGVFDALKQKNTAAGDAGAGFDATLIGRGLSGTADKAGKAAQAAKDAFDANVKAGLGKSDMNYQGHDLGLKPTVTTEQGGWTAPGTDDSGSRYGASGGNQPGGGGTNPNPTPGATDDSGADRSGQQAPQNPNQAPYDPNDPWGNGNSPWGTGG
jgi:hypothetical protein